MYRRRFVLSFLFLAIAVSALATVKPRYRGAGRGAVEHEAEVEMYIQPMDHVVLVPWHLQLFHQKEVQRFQ